MRGKANSTKRRALAIAVSAVVITVAAVVLRVDVSPRAEAAIATSKYVPIAPIRVFNTRDDVGQVPIAARSTIEFAPVTAEVLAAAGVDIDDVTAIVMNVTAVRPAARGFVKIWPKGQPEPDTSVVNPQHAGHVVPNLTTVPLGVDGNVLIYSEEQTDLIFDVQGIYTHATSSSDGRFVALPSPIRAFDSRPTILGADTSIEVDLTPAIPVDATTAVLNVTATQTSAGGFYTVWPSDGSAQPDTSNLNVPAASYNVANQVYAKVHNGKIRVYTQSGGAVIVDVLGYMTGDSATPSSAGLFVPITPQRLGNTRTVGGGTFKLPILADGLLDLPLAGVGDIPFTGAAAVVMNVTAAAALGPGYVAVEPSGITVTGDRATSTLNIVRQGQAVPNQASMRLQGGAIQVYTQTGTEVLVDVVGYFTDGTSTPPPTPAPVDTLIKPPTTRANPTPPTNGAFSFLYRQPSDSSSYFARWNPCAPIRYLVHSDLATPAQVAALNEAIAFAEQASGIDFVFAGSTSDNALLNLSGGGDAPAGVEAVFGFGTSATTNGLGGSSIGVGGGVYYSGARQVVMGYAYADVGDISSAFDLRTTLMHEIGHMLGLSHVQDSSELMFGTAVGNQGFGPGDLRGFWDLGTAQPCKTFGALAESLGADDVGSVGPNGPTDVAIRVSSADTHQP